MGSDFIQFSEKWLDPVPQAVSYEIRLNANKHQFQG
jgi:hypothetical protein